jgi:predicted metalloprotease with PDZ domain
MNTLLLMLLRVGWVGLEYGPAKDCVAVEFVSVGSPAAIAGLQRGDCIVFVNTTKITAVADWQRRGKRRAVSEGGGSSEGDGFAGGANG